MTRRWPFARALAAALLDGPWEATAMRARVLAMIDRADDPPSWAYTIVRATRSHYAAPPARRDRELVPWLAAHPAVHAAADEHAIVRYATPAAEMAESPWRVPALATTRELATWLGVTGDELAVLADRRGISRTSPDPRARHYRYAWIAKRTGGHRLLEAPKPRLRAVQRVILDGILAAIPPHAAAHGFRAGRSVVTFAARHVAHAVVLRLDLAAFFTSVFAARIAGLLRTAGYPDEVAYVLAALCTHRTPPDVLAAAPAEVRSPLALTRLRAPHLPQGAPSSGALANLAAYRLDLRVAGLAARVGATYARYADDLVVSGDRELVRAAPSLIARITAIARDEGFTIALRKTRVMTAATQQRITGVVVNAKLAAPRADVEQLRAILHNCVRHGPASQNRDAHPDFRAHLRGRIAWIAALDAGKGARLHALFDQIRWD